MPAPSLLDLIELWVKEKNYPYMTRPDADLVYALGDCINIGDGKWFVIIWSNGNVEASTWSVAPPSAQYNLGISEYSSIKLLAADPEMFVKLESIIDKVR
jgi:hypothetical protein